MLVKLLIFVFPNKFENDQQTLMYHFVIRTLHRKVILLPQTLSNIFFTSTDFMIIILSIRLLDVGIVFINYNNLIYLTNIWLPSFNFFFNFCQQLFAVEKYLILFNLSLLYFQRSKLKKMHFHKSLHICTRI